MFNYKEGGSRATRINGVAVGIVTNNYDDEKHLGRVKIYFPWLSQKNETDWVRICSFMAGRERGGFFLPEVGDEVLVAFEHGDINSPFVLGSLWSKEDKPPETNVDGKNNIRKIKSRSGHEIIFDDSQGLELLSIHTKSGHNILLDDTPGSEKITIKDKTENNYIEINSSQKSISISSQMDLSIKANSIKIEASENMKITSGSSMTINGSMVSIN